MNLDFSTRSLFLLFYAYHAYHQGWSRIPIQEIRVGDSDTDTVSRLVRHI